MNDAACRYLAAAFDRMADVAAVERLKLVALAGVEAAEWFDANTKQFRGLAELFIDYLAGKIHRGRDDRDECGAVPHEGQAGASDCRQTPQAGDGAPATVSERSGR